MAWQVVLFCSWICAEVQVVPYIIEEEIMDRMGEEDFSTILELKNR